MKNGVSSRAQTRQHYLLSTCGSLPFTVEQCFKTFERTAATTHRSPRHNDGVLINSSVAMLVVLLPVALELKKTRLKKLSLRETLLPQARLTTSRLSTPMAAGHSISRSSRRLVSPCPCSSNGACTRRKVTIRLSNVGLLLWSY